ncbi:M56 family metallopeptidase [Paenibacillus sedimenti]|uniref:M56 family metallopeptidase n=1 Tax=Paenibacillus sedimenti TaxID=2770274 RepID=A0A926KTT5_9BACL|nr:M56 family metallopeptidase [Paenibacillus sedimenti]MBD0382019.1 M56 family metallopeptidase [Paenibacillus sedimenti]
MWETRSKWILFASLATAGIILFQMTSFALHMLFGIRLSFNVFKICLEIFTFLRMPYVCHIIYGFVIYTFAAGFWVIVRQILVSIRSTRRLRSCQDAGLTSIYSSKYRLRKHELVVIQNKTPIALTMGVLKPRIVVSAGLLQMLEHSELDAVMEHEKFHLQHRDPLAIFLLSLLSISMWYVPLFRWVLDKYKIMIEIMADQYAMSKIPSAKDLGSALLKMLKQQGQIPKRSISYASFAETSINLRIMHILEPQTQLSLRMPLLRTLISIVAVLFLVTLT